MVYEYQVIPAPERGVKTRNAKTPQARFAFALQDVMNKMAVDGWEFQRAETLPSTERAGLASTSTQYRNLLIFRRPRDTAPPPPLTAPLIEYLATDIALDSEMEATDIIEETEQADEDTPTSSAP